MNTNPLADWLKEAGVAKTDLAARMGIEASEVSRLLKPGYYPPSAAIMARVVAATDGAVDPNSFVLSACAALLSGGIISARSRPAPQPVLSACVKILRSKSNGQTTGIKGRGRKATARSEEKGRRAARGRSAKAGKTGE